MKKALSLIAILFALQLSAQKKLEIKAATMGEGFVENTFELTAPAKIKSDATELKSFSLKCGNLASQHKLIVTCEGVSLAAAVNNAYTNKQVFTAFTFEKDISNKKITITEIDNNGGVTPYLDFTFVKAGAVIATMAAPASGDKSAGAVKRVFTIAYPQKSGGFSSKNRPVPPENVVELGKNDAGIDVTSIMFQCDDLPDGHQLEIEGAENQPYTQKGQSSTITFKQRINDTKLQVKEKDAAGNVAGAFFFKIVVPGATPLTLSSTVTLPPVETTIDISKYKKTNHGFVSDDDEATVHIFFDMFGNNLFGTVPQGIANHQYIIHIIYPGYNGEADDIDYSVKQKTGTFNSGLIFNNAGILGTLGTRLQSQKIGGGKNQYNEWREKTFLLGIATDNIDFDIVSSTMDESTNKPVTGVLGSYTIKMSPTYHGSFDIGLINSTLINPTYTLVAAPDGSGKTVVKETDAGNRGIVTIMATVYTSPVIWIEKYIFRKKIPDYKLKGRNFLDDHAFYERIYPAIGVSISSKVFENLFFGLNWEFARGISLFGGGHWGKVNTFNMPDFTVGVTPVTQAQFDYYSNTKWDLNWACGAKVDILIITNLFGAR